MSAPKPLSWGRLHRFEQTVLKPAWTPESLDPAGRTILPYGMGRSYGDSCLNDRGALLDVKKWDHFLSFDRANGRMRAEAGVTLDRITAVALPHRWFLPVSPGTKHVTLGGAIANDIHGKNHHRAGTFGCHVTRFELLRSDGQRLLCSPTENRDYFAATIGGLGITGIITWVEIQLKKVPSARLDVETIRCPSLEEFFHLTEVSDETHEYTVSWIDMLARGASLGRGLFMRANHREENVPYTPPKASRINLPFEMPGRTLNQLSVRAFNFVYYRKQFRKSVTRVSSLDPFFYPLDGVANWNRAYGPRGFFQYQFVVPTSESAGLVKAIELIAKRGAASFLCVLKKFGERSSPGWLSFPRGGYTLAVDFPNRGQAVLDLMNDLDSIVMDHGGRIYPAKDARMSATLFQAQYPQWRDLEKLRDPAFSSTFWRRVTSR